MSCLLYCFPTIRTAALADRMSDTKFCLCSNILSSVLLICAPLKLAVSHVTVSCKTP